MKHHTMKHHTMKHYTTKFHTMKHYTIKHHTIKHHTIKHYTMKHHKKLTFQLVWMAKFMVLHSVTVIANFYRNASDIATTCTCRTRIVHFSISDHYAIFLHQQSY